MLDSVKGVLERYVGGLTRREMFRNGGWAAAAGALFGAPKHASAAPTIAGKIQIGPGIYQSIGVRPVINCRGTLTVISGSLELPEVRAAKESASQHYVVLDELAEAVGQRLAELTGAGGGIVSSGCAAGVAHATTACVTGGNSDLHVPGPDLARVSEDEAGIPQHSRHE